MNDSSESLAKNIRISDMKYTSQEFQNVKLMKRKGVYPYDYIDSFDKFNDKNLPSKDKFFCMLLKIINMLKMCGKRLKFGNAVFCDMYSGQVGSQTWGNCNE